MCHQRTLLLAVLALAGPAAAQITEKEAVKQVEVASKSQIKAFKQNADAALATLDANLALAESQLAQDSTAKDIGELVASFAIDYMTSLNGAWENAKALVEFAAHQALSDLADGADLQGLYPQDLYYGGGGVLDKNRAALIKAGIKSRDAALKRLAKTAAKAENVAHIAITFDLHFPTHPYAGAVEQTGIGGLADSATIDLLLTASDLDAQNDGVLVIAGEAGFDSDVTVAFDTVGATDSVDVSPDPGTLRYAGVFEDLPEGGYVGAVRQCDNGAFESVGEIGVR